MVIRATSTGMEAGMVSPPMSFAACATAVELRSGLPVRLSEGTLYGRLPGNRTAMVHLKR